MMNAEEQLWDYIDGVCTASQKIEIEAKIAQDLSFRKIYEEFLAIHQLMEETDLEEPSMSFTRNVMEQVKMEIAPVSLKTKVDNRIIYGIAAFFILSMLSMLIYAVANTTFAPLNLPEFKMPSHAVANSLNISAATTKTGVQLFFFVDIVLGLICMDGFLRKRLS
jgi:hypothetical protein